MFKHFIFGFVLFCAVSARAQSVKVVHFDAVQKLMDEQNDTTYVINFWATWCQPCVHELPNFSRIDSMYNNRKVKVVLVSLDFVKDLQSRLIPFARQNRVTPEILLLYAPDYNAWIDKVDSSWSGSIPATLIFNHAMGKRTFEEKELTFDELNQYLKPYFKTN